MTAHALAEAEVEPIVAVAIDGFIIAHAIEHRLAGSCKCIGERPRKDYISATVGPRRYFLVDVDRLVLMQTEHVGIFRFEDGATVESPGIAEIEFLGHRVPVVGVNDAADGAIRERRRRRRKRGQWTYTILPLSQRQAGSRHWVGGTGQAQYRLENGRIGMLFHEQRNVLEGVAIVQAETAAQHVLPGSR